LKVYPGLTLLFSAINVKDIVMWSKFVPANRSLLFGKQQDQERKHTQKKVVYLGNEGVTLMMLLHKGSVSHLFSVSMSLGVL